MIQTERVFSTRTYTEIGRIFTPDAYSTLKDLAVSRLAPCKNDGKNTNLEAKYPERFSGSDGQVKFEVQLSDLGGDAISDTIRIPSRVSKESQEINVLARVWITQKAKEQGQGKAICYKLGEDGKWYSQEATTYRYDSEKNTDFWDLTDQRPVTNIEFALDLNTRLQGLNQKSLN